ncbi:MAG: T9SS type A sorting domain-containing protein [Bacteroidetes bacterium]|nr:T9SS type A sorting domain-containing protein [Bacteroidota bacterium]
MAYASYIFIDSVYIFDETATAVIDREQQQIMLYPSPATDKIFIKLKDESQIEAVTIYKMDGRLLQKQKYVDGIPISFLSQGIYLIEVKTDKGTLRSLF